MESKPAGPDAVAEAAADPADEVVWSRAWERPRWMEPKLSAVPGWRPQPRTFAVVTAIFLLASLAGHIVTLPEYVDVFRQIGPFEALQGPVPAWVRPFYAAGIAVVPAEALVVLGAGLLLRWRRVGASVMLAGLVADTAAQTVTALGYANLGLPVSRATVVQAIAVAVTRVLLLVLAVLILLPRRQAAAPPGEHAFAPPAP